jgi:hypothetical protein
MFWVPRALEQSRPRSDEAEMRGVLLRTPQRFRKERQRYAKL